MNVITAAESKAVQYDNIVEMCPFIMKDMSEVNIIYKYNQRSDCHYTSNLITDSDIQKWDNISPVWITTQTGMGKTSFIRDVLLDEIVELNKKDDRIHEIVIFVNRTALAYQVKIDIINALIAHGYTKLAMIKEELTTTAISRMTDFEFVHVYTYQSFLQKEVDYDTKNVDYCIFDEAHFFGSDAAFNGYTEVILRKILYWFYDSVRIYMSATPEVVLLPITESECEFRRKYLKNPNNIGKKVKDRINTEEMANAQINKWLSASLKVNKKRQKEIYDETCRNMNSMADKMNVFLYDLERRYDYIQGINVFKKSDKSDKYDSLIEKINENQKDKWLIFINDKDKGKELEEKLKGQAKFISADNKECSSFEEIINDAKFNKRILITTKVLDNGVNIKDMNVKNIAIDVYERVTFLQMLGRIRINNDNHKINLFVFERRIDRIKKDLNAKIRQLVEYLLLPERELALGEVEKYISRSNGVFIHDNRVRFSKFVIWQLGIEIVNLRRIIRLEEKDVKFYPTFKNEVEGEIEKCRIGKYILSYPFLLNVLNTKTMNERNIRKADRRDCDVPISCDVPNLQKYITDKQIAWYKALSKKQLEDKDIESINTTLKKITALEYNMRLNAEQPDDVLIGDRPSIGFTNAEYANWLELPLDKLQLIQSEEEGKVINDKDEQFNKYKSRYVELMEKFCITDDEVKKIGIKEGKNTYKSDNDELIRKRCLICDWLKNSYWTEHNVDNSNEHSLLSWCIKYEKDKSKEVFGDGKYIIKKIYPACNTAKKVDPSANQYENELATTKIRYFICTKEQEEKLPNL